MRRQCLSLLMRRPTKLRAWYARRFALQHRPVLQAQDVQRRAPLPRTVLGSQGAVAAPVADEVAAFGHVLDGSPTTVLAAVARLVDRWRRHRPQRRLRDEGLLQA